MGVASPGLASSSCCTALLSSATAAFSVPSVLSAPSSFTRMVIADLAFVTTEQLFDNVALPLSGQLWAVWVRAGSRTLLLLDCLYSGHCKPLLHSEGCVICPSLSRHLPQKKLLSHQTCYHSKNTLRLPVSKNLPGSGPGQGAR